MNVLETLVTATVKVLGFELVDFEYNNHGKQLRVFIEKVLEESAGKSSWTNAGISAADCERVSRQLQRVLEVEGLQYDRLEVSSPGLDRKLKKAKDFARFAGQVADVRLRLPINGRRRFVGAIREVQEERVEIEVEGARYRFELSNLERARLVPKL